MRDKTTAGSPDNMPDPAAAFIEAAVWHGSLDSAESILKAHPEIAARDIHVAAIRGDEKAVRRFLELDPASATAKGGPRHWDALTHLCFSKYLRLDASRSAGFVRSAQALLDAGAPANTGFFEADHQPEPMFESALYGAAGVAHHAELTRMLIERGADPNDDEVPYHTPESYDNGALKVLVGSGKLTADSLATMLLRKHDWHDVAGMQWLLEHGADPNRFTRWGRASLHQAALRDNPLEAFELALDHGADPTLQAYGMSVIEMAARRGRGDVLDLFERRGFPVLLRGWLQLAAACARNQVATVRDIASREPQLVAQLRNEGGRVLAEFAGNGNTNGVGHLLDLGVEITARFIEGDPYWDVAKDSTALHVAAWRAHHETVKFLIDRGAPVNATDEKGRTPLMLAVRACVDSYWTDRRAPDSVGSLLRAGATTAGIAVPTGYDAIDNLLARAKRS